MAVTTSKKYNSYLEYLLHQGQKLKKMAPVKILEYNNNYRKVLAPRVAGIGVRGKSVLCLAARAGGEVRAFLDNGAFAVGVDLEPGVGNEYVLHGNFEDLKFPDRCADFVFTNALDHAYQLDRVLSEVGRVLKADGKFIVEAVNGTKEGDKPGEYEVTVWEKTDDLVLEIKKNGFCVVSDKPFASPWPGRSIIFKK